MNSTEIEKPANKPEWAQVAVKYDFKNLELSKQRKLTKTSGQRSKAEQLFRVKGYKNVLGMRFHVAFVKEMWT